MVFICTLIISVHDLRPRMLIDAFFTRKQGMQKAALLGVTVTPSAMWRSVKVSDEMSSVAPSQRSLSLFRLQINTCAFLLHHQLEKKWNHPLMTRLTPNVLSCPVKSSSPQRHILFSWVGGLHACTPAHAERSRVKTDCNYQCDAGFSVNLI